MYGKIFESIYDGTLAADWQAMVTFQQFIVLADSEGIVNLTPSALSHRTGIPLKILEHGIAKLQESDPHSRSTEFGGKRIVLLDDHRQWGWQIVNYTYYRDLASMEDRRAKDKKRKRIEREKHSQAVDKSDVSGSVPDCPKASASVRDVHHEDEDEDEDGNGNGNGKSTTAASQPTDSEFEAFKNSYPKRAGSQPWSKARKAINARLKEGHTISEIFDGASRYREYVNATGKGGTEYVMQAATFCGPELHFLKSWKPPPTKSEARQDRNVQAGQEFLNDP